MDYAVYILDLDENVDFEDFVGNTDLATAAVDSLANAASDLVGFSFYEKYTKKLKKDKSVALTGNTVEEVKVTTQIIKRENFQSQDADEEGRTQRWENVTAKDLKCTIVVKGRLEPADTLFGMGQDLAKKKDTSRIWTWANTMLGDAEKNYYRRLIVLVSSTDGKRFRGIGFDKVSVASYEEYFDKNGEGHFTLTMGAPIKIDDENVTDYPFQFKGPDFKQTYLSRVSDITKAANQIKKDSNVVTNAIVAVAGEDSGVAKNIKKYNEKLDGASNLVNGANSVAQGNISADNISDQINKQSQSFREKMLDDKQDADTTTETSSKTLADGSTETTVETTNKDGSKTTKVTTKHADGSVTETSKEIKKDKK